MVHREEFFRIVVRVVAVRREDILRTWELGQSPRTEWEWGFQVHLNSPKMGTCLISTWAICPIFWMMNDC